MDVISPATLAMTDAELIDGMRGNNAEALEALFRRYVRLIYRIAAEILRDRAEAEDVTQEVFLEIYRKAYLYDPARGSVKVWLLQYAYHRTLRRKAALGRRAAYRGEPIEALDNREPDHRQRLTHDECRWVLRAGLAHLPERQRTTLELTCFEDLTLRDVAKRLGVSVGCTRHYYYRGLARLQEWARVTGGAAPECHIASRAGTAGVERDRDRPLYGRT
jgi:RNA polymerase sigma-70 factor (ECF subfamily)